MRETLDLLRITPPPPGSNKTTCPICSPYRRNPSRRCLSVHDKGWGVFWVCHNCGWTGEMDHVARMGATW